MTVLPSTTQAHRAPSTYSIAPPPLKASNSNTSVSKPASNQATNTNPNTTRIIVKTSISPALNTALLLAITCRRLLFSSVHFILVHTLSLAQLTATCSYHLSTHLLRLSNTILLALYHTTGFLLPYLFYFASHGLRIGWQGLKHGVKKAYKRTERIRARIFFEFMVWLLHPSPIMLFVLWPGWILVGGALGIWRWSG